jgi:hypothetical protein
VGLTQAAQGTYENSNEMKKKSSLLTSSSYYIHGAELQIFQDSSNKMLQCNIQLLFFLPFVLPIGGLFIPQELDLVLELRREYGVVLPPSVSLVILQIFQG